MEEIEREVQVYIAADVFLLKNEMMGGCPGKSNVETKSSQVSFIYQAWIYVNKQQWNPLEDPLQASGPVDDVSNIQQMQNLKIKQK